MARARESYTKQDQFPSDEAQHQKAFGMIQGPRPRRQGIHHAFLVRGVNNDGTTR